jgi:hypothetical protein
MTIEDARAAIGQAVWSRDPGDKLIPFVADWHGPYILRQVTKGGECILQGREEFRVPPRLLTAHDPH